MPRCRPFTFTVKLAESEAELRAAQRLRYDVFVRELGGGGEMVDHEAGLEQRPVRSGISITCWLI